MTANAVAIGAAMSVGKDLAEGRLSTEELEREAAERCRELVGTVVGPDDVLWPLQVEVCRGVRPPEAYRSTNWWNGWRSHVASRPLIQAIQPLHRMQISH